MNVSESEIQPLVAEEPFGTLTLLGPVVLALGGILSLAWAYAFGLCFYNLVCWIFE